MRDSAAPGALRSGKLESPKPDAGAMEERVDAALLKEMLGEPLDRRESLVVQWVRNGGGCPSCAGRSPERTTERDSDRG